MPKLLKTAAGVFVILFIMALLALMSGLIYVIDETQQVVITQFGEPIGAPLTQAGLHFKLPLIQQAHYFEKRLLDWDGDPNEIPTRDKKFIWVDTYGRWRISDALKFLQSVGNEIGSQARLDDIINSATRDVITSQLLVEVIRDSNRILEVDEVDIDVIGVEEALEYIDSGRSDIEALILTRASELAPQYGIELIDVRIKRINYVEEVRNRIYARMIAERERAAERYRSEGRGRTAEIEGETGKELKLIASEAYRQAQIIKGTADAEVTSIYAEAFSQDPDFYAFIKTLETYRQTIDENSTVILTTEADYYKYLKYLK